MISAFSKLSWKSASLLCVVAFLSSSNVFSSAECSQEVSDEMLSALVDEDNYNEAARRLWPYFVQGNRKKVLQFVLLSQLYGNEMMNESEFEYILFISSLKINISSTIKYEKELFYLVPTYFNLIEIYDENIVEKCVLGLSNSSCYEYMVKNYGYPKIDILYSRLEQRNDWSSVGCLN